MNRRFFFLAFLALLGCTHGTKFEPPSYDSIVLKETTRQEVLKRFGKPYSEGKILKEEQSILSLSYAHATGGFATGHGGGSVIPARAMVYQFVEDLLVGYSYSSSYEDDHTDFDESKIAEIKKGETTKDQLIALVGPPRGKCVYPMIPGKDDEGLTWNYGQTSRRAFGKLHNYMKHLIVGIGPDGKVTNVEYASRGER